MKLNRLRNLAMALIFSGLIIMYLGVYFHNHQAAIETFFIIGILFCVASMAIYFRLGVISMRLPQVECPKCQRVTKMMGQEDGCMYCGAPVSILNQVSQE